MPLIIIALTRIRFDRFEDKMLMLTQYNVLRPILLAMLSSGWVTWQIEYILSRLELWLS